MENHHSSAAPPNAKGGSGPSAGCPENKDVAVAVPNLSSAAEVAAIVPATASNNDDDDVSNKGKSVAADDKEQLPPHIVAERKRRNRMKDYFGELQALIPQIPEKSDKSTIVDHTIDYIKSLEKTKAMLEKRKQELALARQAGAEAVASSSSAPPQIAQGLALAAMSSDVPDASSDVPPPPPPPLLQPLATAVPVPATSSDVPQPLQQPLAAAEPEPAPLPPPQQLPMAAGTIGSQFQTWSWPDHLVLSVSNNNAYLNVCAPRRRGMWTMLMVLSVLNKYGIDVLTAQVDSDAVRSVFTVYARVTAMGGESPSPVEVYQLAVSEILVWLTT